MSDKPRNLVHKHYTLVEPKGREVNSYKEGRRCRVYGCKTKLSKYNPNEICHGCISKKKATFHEFWDIKKDMK